MVSRTNRMRMTSAKRREYVKIQSFVMLWVSVLLLLIVIVNVVYFSTDMFLDVDVNNAVRSWQDVQSRSITSTVVSWENYVAELESPEGVTSSGTGTISPIINGNIIDFTDFNNAGFWHCVTYMAWQKCTAQTSMQCKLMNDLISKTGSLPFDENGIGIVDGRYTIAMTSVTNTYPDPITGGTSNGFVKVGDYVDIHLTDGKVIPCIIADVKANDAQSVYGHVYSSTQFGVVEIVVDLNKYPDGSSTAANNAALLQAFYGYSSNSEIEFDYIEVGGNYFD